jgi:hypothetical protein
MPRRSVRNLRVRGNINCHRIYPIQGTRRTIDELVTVAFRLTREQCTELARALLAATQDWPMIDVTGYRRRNLITVTGMTRDEEPH